MCLSKSIMWAYFNGKRVNLPEGRAHETLLEFVRDDLGLTGPSSGVARGDAVRALSWYPAGILADPMLCSTGPSTRAWRPSTALPAAT